MRFRSITTKSIAAGLALAVSVPAVALAANPFEDVPEGQWYTEAVDWAYNLGLTTGKTPTTFNGWDNTNRYEMVTMFQRFNEAVIDPILADIDALEADVDALQAADDDIVEMQFDTFGFATAADAFTTEGTTEVEVPVSTSVTVPDGYHGVIVVEFTAETACWDGPSNDFCTVNLYVDGEEISWTGQAFDADDSGTENQWSYGSHSIRAISDEVGPGTYAIAVGADTSDVGMDFRLDDMVLTAEVQLTGEAPLGLGESS